MVLHNRIYLDRRYRFRVTRTTRISAHISPFCPVKPSRNILPPRYWRNVYPSGDSLKIRANFCIMNIRDTRSNSDANACCICHVHGEIAYSDRKRVAFSGVYRVALEECTQHARGTSDCAFFGSLNNSIAAEMQFFRSRDSYSRGGVDSPGQGGGYL